MRSITSISVVLLLLMLVALASGQSETPPPSSTPAETPSAPPPESSPSPSEPPPSSTQAGSSSPASNTPSGSPSSSGGGGGGGGLPPRPTGTSPPDVLLRVPELSVGRIELDVDNLQADVNLNAEIANLVSLNVGVQVGVSKVNITIADVEAQLELIIRLGHLAEIVNRTLQSLDLNPLLINLLNDVTDVVDSVVGVVDGLLGSITQGGTRLNFLIDNLGHIVQQVVGEAGETVSTIVGSFDKNMTYTGVSKELGNGLTQKTYKYDALGSLVNIIFNTLGQVVQAVVVGKDSGGGGGSSSSSAGTTSATTTAASSAPAPTSQEATTTAS